MAKSWSTAAHSGHRADKLVREEERRGEVEVWELLEEGEAVLGSLHSQSVGTLSVRAGRRWMGEAMPLVKPP